MCLLNVKLSVGHLVLTINLARRMEGFMALFSQNRIKNKRTHLLIRQGAILLVLKIHAICILREGWVNPPPHLISTLDLSPIYENTTGLGTFGRSHCYYHNHFSIVQKQ